MSPPVDTVRRLAALAFLALWAASLALSAVVVLGTPVPGWKVLAGGWSESPSLAAFWLANPVGLAAAAWSLAGRRAPWWLALLAFALAFSSLAALWPLREVRAGYGLWLAAFAPITAVALWDRFGRRTTAPSS